jgi:cytochrome c556
MHRPIVHGLIAALLLTGCMSASPPAAPPPESKAAPQRAVVPLTTDEREHVLGEMRDFLAALQGVTDGLARDDFGAVAAAARKVGAGSESGRMPPAIAKKLPPEFRRLAKATHDGFDLVAADAAARRDARHTLAQTSALMQRCNACHAAFQFPH